MDDTCGPAGVTGGRRPRAPKDRASTNHARRAGLAAMRGCVAPQFLAARGVADRFGALEAPCRRGPQGPRHRDGGAVRCGKARPRAPWPRCSRSGPARSRWLGSPDRVRRARSYGQNNNNYRVRATDNGRNVRRRRPPPATDGQIAERGARHGADARRGPARGGEADDHYAATARPRSDGAERFEFGRLAAARRASGDPRAREAYARQSR